MGIEPRPSHLLSTCSTTEVHLQPLKTNVPTQDPLKLLDLCSTDPQAGVQGCMARDAHRSSVRVRNGKQMKALLLTVGGGKPGTAQNSDMSLGTDKQNVTGDQVER